MIVQTLCTSFLLDLYTGRVNVSSTSPYEYRLALYSAMANLGESTSAYTALNEIVDAGYTVTGKRVIPTMMHVAEEIAYFSFNDIRWNLNNTIARGGLIYNFTLDSAVCVLDFGSDKLAGSPYVIKFPPSTPETALIRLQSTCDVFSFNMLQGLEDFSGSSPYSYKIALYTGAATLNNHTLQYTPLNEILDVNYTVGGGTLAPSAPFNIGRTVYTSFADVSWGGYLSASLALIYNATTNAAVGVLDLGGVPSFRTIHFPPMLLSTTIM